MPLQLRNGTFGPSCADCDVIRAKIFRFFEDFGSESRALSRKHKKRGGGNFSTQNSLLKFVLVSPEISVLGDIVDI